MASKGKSLILIADLGLFLGLLQFLPFSEDLNKGLSLLIFIAILWLTEALPIAITALLVPVLALLLKIHTTPAALSNFANPIIFLFLGGFALATALHMQGLDRIIANQVLRLSQGRLKVAALLLFAISALLSMWISNTATTAMMLPLALGLLSVLPSDQHQPTYKYLLLGIAYSASIGGIATLVGSPPNAIAAAEANVDFHDWILIGLPLALLLLPLALVTLYLTLRPNLNVNIDTHYETHAWSIKQRLTLALFLLVVFMWVFSKPLSKAMGDISQWDSVVALVAIVIIGALGLADWKSIEKHTDWGVLVLFGGGLTLSSVLKDTGTSVYLADYLASLLASAPLFLVLLSITVFVIFLTEIASNTASAALLVPVFAAVAEALGLSPVIAAVVIAVSASCAFMLPVATPPNAIVFGSGYIQQQDMIKVGLRLNLLCAGLIATYFYIF